MELKTRSGNPLHPIGIGTWNIASRWVEGKQDSTYKGTEAVRGNEAQEIEAIRYSIAKGQNHIDTAELYGARYTDIVIGQAIAPLPKKDLYIAEKLWRTSIGPGKVRGAVDVMLKSLGTDYIDLLYVHHPWDGWQAAMPQIDELIDDGLVGALGISNFSLPQMQQAMALAKHPIVANQMNYNVLYKQEVSQAFRDFCKQHNICIVAYQPLKRQEVLQNSVIQNIAKQRQATEAQVALAWLLQQGALPIPKALAKAHIDENLGALDLKLSSQEIAALNKL